jgi:DNA-binding transcriptional ArsR family regulator
VIAMKKNDLEDIDDCHRLILVTIIQTQIDSPKGITWGELWDRNPIKQKMSRQTFSHRLKNLLERGVVEKEVIKNRKGKPTFYRVNSGLFTDLREIREKNYPWNMEKAIDEFEKDIANYDTKLYVEALLELAFGQLNLLAILLNSFELEGARWMFYETNYLNLEQILKLILNRARRSRTDKEQTMLKLFEILEPLAKGQIGKQFGLDEVYNARQELIDKISPI